MSHQGGFSIDQLMELAGLSVASAVATEYPVASHGRVLVLAGPGNNGGDGLVAARHLCHFGYSVSICYPKPTNKPLYQGLVTQCQALGIDFKNHGDVLAHPLSTSWDVVIDALFGFSFKGPLREPFDALITAMSPPASPPPIVAVDIPSGWDVEHGDNSGVGLRPDMLVSLTTPKLCARWFTGQHHYLGGRFVPPFIVDKYELRLPPYPGSAQCVRIGPEGGEKETKAQKSPSVADMRLSYTAGLLLESTAAEDPWSQFSEWFESARQAGLREPNAMALASCSGDAPSVRFVLMKGFGPRGIVFFTNYDSRKGMELESNPNAAATFWWDPVERQVRFEGKVERLPADESDAYWDSRPWEHQVGGLASRQSSVVAGGREELEKRLEEAEAAHPRSDGPVPRPSHWGGYVLRPKLVEFWQGRPSRLHDRLRYTMTEGGSWQMERLAP